MGEAKDRLEAKKKAFEANPDAFVAKNDIILGALRMKDKNGDDTIGYGMGTATTHEIYTAWASLQLEVIKMSIKLDAMRASAEKSSIIKPGDNGRRFSA